MTAEAAAGWRFVRFGLIVTGKGEREQATAVFQRYRQALDLLLTDDERRRVAVHFLVMMLEAYYFAHAAAVNVVLGTNLTDHAGDVEQIPHPKGHLKQLVPGFDERQHGAEIVAGLDVPHILSRPDTCASLRTLFAWCVKAIGEPQSDRYALQAGRYSEVTRHQIDALGS